MKKALLVLFVALAVLGMTGLAMAQEVCPTCPGSGDISVTENIAIDGINIISSDIDQLASNSGNALAEALAKDGTGPVLADISGTGNDNNKATLDDNMQTAYATSGAFGYVEVGNYVESDQSGISQSLVQHILNEIVANSGSNPIVVEPSDPETGEVAIYLPTTGAISVDKNLTLEGANIIQSELNQTALNSGGATAKATADNWLGGASLFVNGTGNDNNTAGVFDNMQDALAFADAEVIVYNEAYIDQSDNDQKLLQEIDDELTLITGSPTVDILVDVDVLKEISIEIKKILELSIDG